MISQLRTGTPITVAGITLIPIERLRISFEKQPYVYWLNVTKEALAVVICDSEGPRVVDVEAHERSIGEFIAAMPELESLLKKYPPP